MKYVKFQFRGQVCYGKVMECREYIPFVLTRIPSDSTSCVVKVNKSIFADSDISDVFFDRYYNCYTLTFESNILTECSKEEYLAAMVLES